jgi:hypothetical protein
MSSVLVFFLFMFPPSSDSLETSVVATVGRFDISGRDLLDSYELGPAFVKRAPHSLRKHLEYMIDERLLALEGERTHSDTTRFVQERTAAIQEDLTVDELYKNEILSKVKLADDETEWGVQKAKTNLRLRWIYSKDEQSAKKIHSRLLHGASFDSVFARQALSDSSASGRALETTGLKLERDIPELARNLSKLKSQEISRPIKGSDGYYLVRIDEIWQNPLTTETDYATLKNQAVEILRQVKADKLASEFVSGKMRVAHPVIKADGFNIVRALLAEKGLSLDARVNWEIPSTFMTEAGSLPISASAKLLNRPLVVFSNQTMTVSDYAKWFDIRQFQLKTSSLATFNASVKQTIWKMVQDRILSQEAYSRRLNMQENVRRESEKWEPKILYLAERQNILRTISISDSTVKAEFEKQKKSKNVGKSLGFGDSGVREDLYRQEEMKAVFRTLQHLQKEIPIVVQESTVQRLSEKIEKEINPIDIIFYKPGGTYPRIAFPTIDAWWQAYE